MYLTELMIIMLLSLLIWFWLDSIRVNEIARSIGANVCRKNNVQFLDETVHLYRFGVGKNSFGQFKLLRHYKYEFTNNEFHRYQGELTLAGKQLIASHMDAYRMNELQ